MLNGDYMKAKEILKKLIKQSIVVQMLKANKYYSSPQYLRTERQDKCLRKSIFFYFNKANQYKRLLENIRISIKKNKRFQVWIDTNIYFSNIEHVIDALPPDYGLIINNSLNELLQRNKKNGKVAINNRLCLFAIKNYIYRIINHIDQINDGDIYLNNSINFFKSMIDSKANTLEEGLQRILFWSSLFWQTGHRLVGLGRLDKVLADLERPDDDEMLDNIIIDFMRDLHDFYGFKSNELLGDTGQLIELGGKELDGSYYINDLTYGFIRAARKIKLPDPKLMLRVSHNIPEELLLLGIRCIASGIGSPILANDETIIPALETWGYSEIEAHNYVTSACWEPLAYGKGFGRGNLANIDFAEAFVNTYEDEEFLKLKTYEELVDLYKSKLVREVRRCLNVIDSIYWEEDPLMTLFTCDCLIYDKDISEGGAKYSDYGILSVGMSNAVNSIFNIRDKVFKEKKYTLFELKSICNLNYKEHELDRQYLYEANYFGNDEEDVIAFVNDIMNLVSCECEKYRNRYGGKVKFGLSSPNYLDHGKNVRATMDGRKEGVSLSTHISCKNGLPYTNLINFASKLSYSMNKCNGNVIDFFVSPTLLLDNIDKFKNLIYAAINEGFFEMQMNVVDSSVLLKAKERPEEYGSLVVRVWGFSAYFVDLPIEYQDVLIQRALESESR